MWLSFKSQPLFLNSLSLIVYLGGVCVYLFLFPFFFTEIY